MPTITRKPRLPGWARSPLRYPGGKTRLAPTIATLLENHQQQPETLVEAFCGGASVSLALLHWGLIDQAVIADKDPLVASFWAQATTNTSQLTHKIEAMEVSLEAWQHWTHHEPANQLEAALKCLFLNRTSFSGIIGAGPIGGRNQQSNYRIGCRFNKDTIIARIQNAGQLHAQGRLETAYADWTKTINQHDGSPNTLFYLDPPYVQKSHRLYQHAFTNRDHQQLTATLPFLESPWVCSYDTGILDQCPETKTWNHQLVVLPYSGNQKRNENEVLFIKLG